MTIGEFSRETGVAPSAIRYYERMGLVPAPQRRSGRREYDASAVAHLAIVQFARATGFTLKETRQLVRGFSPGTTAGDRWRALASHKAGEMDALIARAGAMKSLLGRMDRCECETLVECGRRLARTRQRWALPGRSSAAPLT